MSFKKYICIASLALFLLVVAGCADQTPQNIQKTTVDESQPHGHSESDAHE